ncbi:MAG: nitroreductase family protein [Bernardetiaceae bacterium]
METDLWIDGYPHERYTAKTYTPEEMIQRTEDFYYQANQRRTVRTFSDKPIPRAVIENILLTASTAPSGANRQPWTFCVVADPAYKARIRAAAEEEERKNYQQRMPDTWLDDLRPIGTSWEKPFLEIAPYLIVVFRRNFEMEGTQRRNNYYVSESVGLACGMLIQAIHHAGLVTVTHTPSPMGFLADVLDRPHNERPFLLLPVGYPAEEVYVPKIKRKPLDQIAVFYE